MALKGKAKQKYLLEASSTVNVFGPFLLTTMKEKIDRDRFRLNNKIFSTCILVYFQYKKITHKFTSIDNCLLFKLPCDMSQNITIKWKKNNKKSSVLFEQCSNSIGYWIEINRSNNMGVMGEGRRLFKKYESKTVQEVNSKNGVLSCLSKYSI